MRSVSVKELDKQIELAQKKASQLRKRRNELAIKEKAKKYDSLYQEYNSLLEWCKKETLTFRDDMGGSETITIYDHYKRSSGTT